MNSPVFWKYITKLKEVREEEEDEGSQASSKWEKEEIPEPITLEEEAEQESSQYSGQKSNASKEKGPRKVLIHIKKRELKNIPILAYYFSASWCKHCQEFTPQLIDFYNEVNKDSKQIEIIHLSYD